MDENKAILGLNNEVEFVKKFNENNNQSILEKMGISTNNVLAVHLKSTIYSEYHKKKVYPKSDVFLIENKIHRELLVKENFYLGEHSKLLKESLNDIYIPNTGISIKLKTNKYTIHKMGPTFFNNVFKISELGAGASIYCTKNEDIIKNKHIYTAWGTSKERIQHYFNETTDCNLNLDDLEDLKIIKKFSNETIKKMIKDNESISDLIFKGKYARDPYCANWIYDQKGFRKINTSEDFNVTTGSGRSKGNYTLVIKP